MNGPSAQYVTTRADHLCEYCSINNSITGTSNSATRTAEACTMMDQGDDDERCSLRGSQEFVQPNNGKSLGTQLVLSLLLGVSAFFVFCLLRPRWPALYAARKRRLDPSISPPKLSNSAFGWIPQLYRITEEQILASAGLDAFVFLAFFKMSIRLFAIMAFFATAILWPINAHYRDFRNFWSGNNNTRGNDTSYSDDWYRHGQVPLDTDFDFFKGRGDNDKSMELTYLWSYVAFTYLFAALTIYFMNVETFRIIRYRQDYLGTQSTVTDRTFRLTGIPPDLRNGDRIKHLIQKLGIGNVEKVTVCRDWRYLDTLVERRDETLRKLEASWAKLLKTQRGAGENGHLIPNDHLPSAWDERDRPQTSIPYGFLGIRHKKVDAIDYYEEKLRRFDSRIIEARKKEYTPTDMALVTMDSVASCQMVIQARIDPRPGSLLTKETPSPSDLVWKNTYALRGIRRLKSWSVTIFITILTIVWIFPTAFMASLLSFCAIEKVAPGFAHWLEDHAIIHSLVQNGLPTLVVSLLNVAVPYLYDWLANCQGMISQSDVELSVISKNFFFTFFNTFFVFAVSSTGFDFWPALQDLLKNTSKIPTVISQDVEKLSIFFTSFIMLQGIGLMPFRILEAGSVFLYPFYRMISKTPRDFEELKKPPVFQYGFYLPTALLVFNLCLIYSVLRMGCAILIVGTIYFSLGYFAFKYMVLYAMDQPQHATGGAWRIICYRIIIGLVVFQVVMVGQIAIEKAFFQSVAVLPLIPFTIWYSYYIKKRFEPLTRYIALRAIRADEDPEDSAAMDEIFEDDEPRPSRTVFRRGSTLDEHREKGLKFVNPSLITPLQRPWIYEEQPPDITDDDIEAGGEEPPLLLRGADGTLGIGEDNVWTDSRANNV